MTASLDYFYSMVSPWACIGHDAFHDIVARHGVTVTYRPVALLEAFDRTNTPRLPDRHQTRQATTACSSFSAGVKSAGSISTCSPHTGRSRSKPPTAW